MSQIEVAKLLDLPVEEKLALVRALWESIASGGATYPISDAERVELERRLASFDDDPNAGSSFAEVERRITSR